MELEKFLSSNYNSENFIKFLSEKIKPFEEFVTEHTDEELNEIEKKEIESYRYLGKVELKDEKEIGFFEFRSKTPNIENKRVGFNKILKKLAGDYILDGAVASFYNENSDVWRLSFIGFDYDIDKVEVTNLKRYTFVLGNVPIKTALNQLQNLNNPTFEELKEAFSVEKVTNEFYEKYCLLYEKVLKEVENIRGKNSTFKEIEIFAKKLLGRIIFLYFLQKKGWLGVAKRGKWGEGNKKFLYFYFEKALSENKNFYEEYLKKIFFEALNTKRRGNYFEKLDCKIPFLNGGLFEAEGLDNELLFLSNELFKEIFEVFNEYNFTIIEDSPEDKEVAIDPEMMGKVFENLLDENYRKGKGAFYTPREIVHYMCQKSIINYLLNFFDKEKEIVNLVIKKETDNKFILKNGNAIKDKLLSMKIVDLAIGSGAFPMGLLYEITSILLVLNKSMSQKEVAKLKRKIIENSIYGIDIDYSAVEIAKLRFWLSLVVDEEEPTPLPNLFYKIMVGNSLFETINGDDLLKENNSSLFASNDEVKKIQKLIHKFYNQSDSQKKKELKNEIEKEIDNLLNEKIKEQKDLLNSNLINNLEKNTKNKKTQEKDIKNSLNNLDLLKKVIETRPTTELFFYKIYFAEVLNRGGFDIVIGNPPYIRHEKIGKSVKERLKQENFYNPITKQMEKYECFDSTADIYIYFFEKGFRLLSQNGILSFITSNKYSRAKYGAKFREFLLNNATLKEYIDFNGVKVFESATVDTSIISFSRKREENRNLIYCDVKEDYKKEEALFDYVEKNGIDYSQNELSADAFTFLSPQELAIKKRIEKVGTPLKEWEDVKIYRGILTGFNEAFIIDEETKNRLIKEDKKSAEIIKPLLRGRDIKKYGYEFKNIYIIGTFPALKLDIENYPAIKKYLESFGDRLKQDGVKGHRKKTSNKWFETQDNIAYYEEFEKEKIVWAETSQELKFVIDENKFYLDKTCFLMLSNDNRFLLSVLNSKVMDFYLRIIASSLGKNGLSLSKMFVEKLPIPQISKEKQAPFEKVVDIIIELKKNNENEKAEFFEKVIDAMVNELYFEDEVKIIKKVSNDLNKNLTADELFELWSEEKI